MNEPPPNTTKPSTPNTSIKPPSVRRPQAAPAAGASFRRQALTAMNNSEINTAR